MEQPLSHLSLLGAAALHPGTPTQSLPSLPAGTTSYGHQIPPEVIDQIEVLKQQLRVYADDFATEREDRKRNQSEKEKLKEELDAVKDQLGTLEQQVWFDVNIHLTTWVENVQSDYYLGIQLFVAFVLSERVFVHADLKVTLDVLNPHLQT